MLEFVYNYIKENPHSVDVEKLQQALYNHQGIKYSKNEIISTIYYLFNDK